jgi:hypothetical protein
MLDRPIEHRGLLRAVRRHPVARLCAVLALFTYVLVGISPLWVPAVEGGGIEVCTANGIRIIPTDLPISGAPDGKQQPKRDCPLCTIQAASLLPAADGAVKDFGDGASAFVLPPPAGIVPACFVGFNYLSRAPPLPS